MLPRVSAPANASVPTRDAKRLGVGRERPQNEDTACEDRDECCGETTNVSPLKAEEPDEDLPCLTDLRAWEDAERPLLHVLAAVDRDIGAGHERRLVRA
jgi:hypothetical protein